MAGCADTMVQNSPNSECVICCEEIFGNKSQENCPKEPRATLKHLKKDDYELVLDNSPPLPPRPYRLGYNCAARKFKCKKRKEKEKCFETLEMPIGIAFSTLSLSEYNLTSEKIQRSQAYSTCLVAFAETYLTPESEWDSIILNRIMTEGNRHYLSSVSAIQALMPDEDVVEINENLISTTVILCRNNFDLELFQPFIIGQLQSKDPTIPTFGYSCKLFFRKYNYCLLSVAGLHFFIWRRYGSFFLFDPNGRDTNFKRDFEAGCIIVLALRSFDNLNCYITKLSGLAADDVFTIRRIRVIWLLPFIPPNTIYKRVRSADYCVIDEQHASLKGHIHLEMSLFSEFHGKLYHVVAMIAILLSKIDPPSTWDSYVVDEILLLSKLKYTRWAKRNGADLRIQDIPTIVNLGAYKTKSQFMFCELCGTWSYVPNYRFSHLTIALRQMFCDSTNLILEIGPRFYPIWKRQGFFYLLDSYQHGCTLSSPFVHMCSTINSLCCVLHYNVLEIMAPTDFALHKVVIIEILRNNYLENICLDDYSMIYEAKNEEIISLNESIEDIQWTIDLNVEEHCAPDDYQNLDSPGISTTQIVPPYMALKDELEGSVDFNLDECQDDGYGKRSDDEVGYEQGFDALAPKEQRIKDGKDRGAKDTDGTGKDGKDPDGKGKGGKDQDDTDKGGKNQDSKDKGGKEKASKGADGRGGDTSKSADAKSGDTSKGADARGGDTSQGADARGGDTSQGADARGGDPSKGADARGGDPSKGADARGGDPSKGADARGGDPSKGADARGGDTSKGADGKGGDTSKGADGRGGDTYNAADGRGADTSKGTDGRGADRPADGTGGDRPTDGRGADRPADGRGGDRPADGRGGDRPADGRGGDRPADDRGGDRPTDGRGGDRPTDGRGGDRPTDGRGGDRPTDGRGGDRPTDGRGGDRPTDGRYEDSPTDGRYEDRPPDGRYEDRTADGRGADRTTDGRGADRTSDGRGADRTIDGRGSDRRAPYGETTTADRRDVDSRGEYGRVGGTRDIDRRGSYPRGHDRGRGIEEYDDRVEIYENLTNSYPGYTCTPHNLAVAGSQTGSPESIANLITTALKVADRVLVMVPWGNYIVFRFGPNYLLYDGCTCNIDRFRHLDLTKGTAGLLCHATVAELVGQIMCGNAVDEDGSDCSQIINEILDKYGN